MKKQLLCTSAIALGVAAAAPASAQDWNLDWGGFFNTHVGFADVGGNGIGVLADFDGIQMANNAEIIFTPSITLDNGLTFGVNVQMEAANAGGGVDGIDESYASISGDSFGRIDIGYENSAGYKMMVAAPSVGSFAINSGSFSMFLPFTGVAAPGFRNASGSSFTEVGADPFTPIGNNDPMRISYYTPSFSGLTVGISYAPSGTFNASAGAPVNRGTNVGIVDIFDIGVNYSQSFGTTDLTLSARWGTADNTFTAAGVNSDPETWGVGFQVGFNGVTVGGAYAENDSISTIGLGDSEGWSLGVAYDAPGPWTFGLETYQGEVNTGGGTKDDYEIYKLAGSRNLGPGVSWDIFLIQGESKDGSLNLKTDATAIGTSLNLSF